MKKIIVFVLFVFAGFFVVNNFAPEQSFIKGSTAKVMMPARYAELLSRAPETRIQIPIRNLYKKQIADTFGAPRGADREHLGQDIFARRGTPVYSATDGIVWRVGENGLGGNTVSVLGAGGRVYYYAHLEKYAADLNVGGRVTPETVLGYVGTSGNARGTPPHLHFAVYSSSGAINPLALF